jgi:hypothetical protein
VVSRTSCTLRSKSPEVVFFARQRIYPAQRFNSLYNSPLCIATRSHIAASQTV